VTFGGFAQHLGNVLCSEATFREAQRAVDVGLVHGAGRVGLEREACHVPLATEILGQFREFSVAGMRKGEEQSMRAFEHRAWTRESFLRNPSRMQAAMRRPARVQALGPGALRKVFDDAPR